MRGFTLVELVAVLAILALILGVTAVAWRPARPTPAADVVRTLDSVRAVAVRAGRTTPWRSGTTMVRFQPDGSSSGGTIVIGTETVTVDVLTGAVHAR